MRAPRQAVLMLWIGAHLAAVAPPACGQNVNNYGQLPRPLLYLMLLREPAVQRELGLDADSENAVASWNREIDAPLLASRNRSPQEFQQRADELATKTRAALSEMLDAGQQQRVEEIMLRVRGIHGLVEAPVASELQLTAEQSDKIEGIIAKANSEVEQLRRQDARGEGPPDAAAKATEIRETEQRDILALLDQQQQQKLKTLVGPAFDLSQLSQVSFRAPQLSGGEQWLNSAPMEMADFEGKVVALHFWAFGCINCQRNFPWYRGWAKDFAGSDFHIIGVHTPELPLERDVANVEEAVGEAKFDFPILIDNEHRVWNAWGNSMWPAVYLIDKRGRIRYWWYGELNWQGAAGEPIMRQRIEQLLAEEP